MQSGVIARNGEVGASLPVMDFLKFYFSKWSGSEVLNNTFGVSVLNFILLAFVLFCAYTDTKTGKILNKVTFPTMILGIVLNTIFGNTTGLMWALVGWAVGMGIQWIPYMLGFAKAGDVKFLAAVGALKGWAFCTFGFLYGAAAFGFILVPWLASRGELKGVWETIKGYFAFALVVQKVPDAPAPTTKRKYVPWGLGLAIGFLIALAMEQWTGRVFWLS